MTDQDRTTLVQRLRGFWNPSYAVQRPVASALCEEAADELDRLNAQALELCAELSAAWRGCRELASAQADLAYARSTGDECALEVDGLRKGLAEARELLREWRDKRAWDLRDGAHWLRLFQDDVDALDAFLAATVPPAPDSNPAAT